MDQKSSPVSRAITQKILSVKLTLYCVCTVLVQSVSNNLSMFRINTGDFSLSMLKKCQENYI